jgi:hypothetical protein
MFLLLDPTRNLYVKQHPTAIAGFHEDEAYVVDPSITNYYVIDINRKILTEGDNKFGPLTLAEFNSLRKKLKIENICFDKTSQDNPQSLYGYIMTKTLI